MTAGSPLPGTSRAGGPGTAGPPPVDDEELTALALAADPETVVGDDAVPLRDLRADDGAPLLPAWYMPAPSGGRRRLGGWRRRLVFVIVAAFVLINAYGLCSTYGCVVPA